MGQAWLCTLGDCTLYVDPSEGYTRVDWPDGEFCEARPHLRGVGWCSDEQADAYEQTALNLGYGVSERELKRMNAEHDPLHVWASVALLKRRDSPMLRSVATGRPMHPTKHPDAAGFEERLVQALQLWLNTGRETEPLALLWWQGHLPPMVEQEARRFLALTNWHPV